MIEFPELKIYDIAIKAQYLTATKDRDFWNIHTESGESFVLPDSVFQKLFQIRESIQCK